MGEEYQHMNLEDVNSSEALLENNRKIMEDGDECYESSFENSTNSLVSSNSSSDFLENASPSPQCSSSSLSLANGPLYELSELMLQLPIKRGLSKYYDGQSQSFTSLASVNSIEDLAKKGNLYRTKIKSCRRLDGHNKLYIPKATIVKKASRRSYLH
ncbi:hypothetical protein CFOL_v3_27793 [Cephalotus follicularis]|uniref:Oxidative stress 3 n=1 Tax=Cephalotus follicularis TaxID=3775 RepID=A0A1Q3CVT8_CEPFO|nr:hypothetical protein CFOL_v3_27793 [Cephalotus follicularis]